MIVNDLRRGGFMKRKILSVIQVALLLIIVISSMKIYNYQKSLSQTDKIESETRQILSEVEKSSVKASNRDIGRKFISKLKQDYPNAVGYINIEDTNISYPIVQTDDNSFYLNHAPNDEWNPNGSIFMSYLNKDDFSDDNTVIYGHNVRSGKLFQNLHKLRSQDFYDEVNTVQVYTSEGIKNYQIFTVYKTHPDYQYKYSNFDSTKEKNNFIKDVLDKSLVETIFDESVLLDDNSQIITLSTCEVGGRERIVVQGYEVKD